MDNAISNKALWTGSIISGLAALFLLADGVMKLIKPAPIVHATLKLGYPESTIVLMGAILTLSTLLYILPRTSILGAILLTGYLGGAVATQLRVEAILLNQLFRNLRPSPMGRTLAAPPAPPTAHPNKHRITAVTKATNRQRFPPDLQITRNMREA